MRSIFILSLGAVLLLLLSSFVDITPVYVSKDELFSELNLVKRDMERGVPWEEIKKEVIMHGFNLARDGSCFNLSQGDSFISACLPSGNSSSCLFLQADVEPRITYVGENVSYRALGISSCRKGVEMKAFLLLPSSCPLSSYRNIPRPPIAPVPMPPDSSSSRSIKVAVPNDKCAHIKFNCSDCVQLGCWTGEYEVSAEMGIKPLCFGNYTIVTILSDGKEEVRSDVTFLAMAVSVSARADPDKVRSGDKVTLIGSASAFYDVITSYQAVLLTPSGKVFLEEGAGNYTKINKTYHYVPQKEGSYLFMFIVYDKYGKKFQAEASFSDSNEGSGKSSSSCPTFALSISGDRYRGYTVTVTYYLEQIWNVELCVDGRCWSSHSSPVVGCGALSVGGFNGDACHYAHASGSGRTSASASRSFGACSSSRGGSSPSPSPPSPPISPSPLISPTGVPSRIAERASVGYSGPRIPERVFERKMRMT
ncbi:MAG: hypothetical protein ACPL09_00930 [Candidatus Methanodesulfokora sp.]